MTEAGEKLPWRRAHAASSILPRYAASELPQHHERVLSGKSGVHLLSRKDDLAGSEPRDID
jgi:hypothetical protein